MRKLLILFFLLMVTVVAFAQEQDPCNFVNDSCKVQKTNIDVIRATGGQIVITNPGGTINAVSGGSRCVLSSLVWRGELKEIHIITTDDMYKLKMSYRTVANGSVYTTDTNIFAQSCGLYYNGQRVGTVNIIHNGASKYLYLVFGWDAGVNIPEGATITTTLLTHWLPYCPYYECWPTYSESEGSSIVYHAPDSFTASYTTDAEVEAWIGAIKLHGRNLGGNWIYISLPHFSRAKEIYIKYNDAFKIYNLSYCKGVWHNLFLNLSAVRNVVITNSTATVYSANTAKTVVSSPTALNLKIQNVDYSYLYSNALECIAAKEKRDAAKLLVRSASGILIKSFKLIDSYGSEIIADNYTANVDAYLGYSINGTVIPHFIPKLAENISTGVIVEGSNYANISGYYYSLTLKAYYRNVLGKLIPIGFWYSVTGDAKPDKTNSIGEIGFAGVANEAVTLQVPAGTYNITVKTKMYEFERVKSYTLDLYDNQYYKTLSFEFGIIGEDVELSEGISALLTVITQDQLYRLLDNVEVRLYKNNTLVATQYTHNGGVTAFSVDLGETYTLKAYVFGVLKAEKTLIITNSSELVVLTLNINHDEYMRLQNETETGGTGGTGGTGISEIQVITTGLLANNAFWGLIIVIGLAIIAAANAGERIGLITFVAALGVFTYIIPLLPSVIFIIVAIVAMILFSWKVVGRLVGGGEE